MTAVSSEGDRSAVQQVTLGGRKGLQLASPALPVLISPLRTERLRCQPGQASQVSLTLQERGCSPVLFPQALPFGTPDTRPLLDIDSEPPPLDREVLPLPVEPSGQSASELVHHSLAGAFLWAWPASLPLHGDTQEDSKGGFALTLRRVGPGASCPEVVFSECPFPCRPATRALGKP